MTISKDSSAPPVVVVGATGTQGGSVVNNLDVSDKPYRVRGLTRDVSKPVAQALVKRGVEMVGCNIGVGKEKEVEKAFKDATYIFMVTDHWEHMDKAREIAEGKLMIDAAKAVGAKVLLVSSLPSVTKLSEGRPPLQARSSGLPYIEIHVGSYMNNYRHLSRPRPAGDGTYVFASTWKPEMRLPLIDTYHDTGLFARLAIESEEFNKGDGKVIFALVCSRAGQNHERGLGKRINYVQLSDEQLGGGMKAEEMPQDVVDDILQMSRFLEENWEQNYIHSNRTDLARAPRTFKEYCKTEEWNKILA